jgi:hypothetical protein
MSSPGTDSISIRSGTDADIPAVIELMKATLGEGNVPRTAEFWHWKHRHNPFGSSPMWLAHSGPSLVGVRLFMRWGLRADERRYTAVRAVDTATHPDFQGKGIFKRLTLKLVDEEQRAGTNLIFNTPNDQSRPGYLKMSWQTVGRLSLWLLPRRPLQLVRAALAGPAPAKDDAGPLEDRVTPGCFDAANARGLLSFPPSERFHTPTSAAYLAWRYSAPGLTYGVSDTEEALVVFRLRRRGRLRELRICDMFARDLSAKAVLGLRRCIASAVARHQPDYVVAALRPEATELMRMPLLGFLPAPRVGPILTVRPLNLPPGTPDPSRPGNWSASAGDLELF